MQNFNFYSIPPLISSLLFAGLGIYVYVHQPTAVTNRAYACWCLLTFFWQGSWAVLFNTQNPILAEIIVRIGYSGITFLPVAYYHFVTYFLDIQKEEKFTLRIFYGCSLIFLIFIWTGKSFINGFYKFSWGYYPKAGLPIHPLFLVFVSVTILRAPLLIYRKMRRPHISPIRKNQLKYVLIALLVYDLAATDFLVNYGVSFYPLGVIAIVGTFGVITYTIVKYRLMDIRIFIRRAMLLTSVYLALLLGTFPCLFLIHKKIINDPKNSWSVFIGGFLMMGIVTSVGPFLYAYFVKKNQFFHESAMAGLTHELKSPLAVIQGALDIMSEEVERSSFDKIKAADYVKIIKENTSRLETYVQNFFNVAKIKQENFSIDMSWFDLSALLFDVIDSHLPLTEKKTLHLKTNIQSGIQMEGDEPKIRQVLSNIILNSIKFSEKGTIHITLNQTIGEISCEVADTGTGIERKDLKKIFDRFYQVKPNMKGSGIGLTIAKAWVEAHGGKIWTESDGEGKGTKVMFTLPIN